MRLSLKTTALLLGLFAGAGLRCAAGTAADSSNAVTLAQKQITAYLAQLADLHCTESVTQEKIGLNGHVTAAAHDQFDYLIMMSGNNDDFQLNESRMENSQTHRKLLAQPMLVTNGMSTALLVFHPYYRSAFTFTTGEVELINGRAAIPIHFSHITGRRTPIALALRDREFPLDIDGIAWLDERSQQVVRVTAHLARDMSDVGLKSLEIRVEYKPQFFAGHLSSLSLPSEALVEVTTPRQHWRNTHTFTDYKSFSTEVEQDPHFKVHPDKPAANAADGQTPQGAPKTQ